MAGRGSRPGRRALGLVHVVCGDEQGDALAGELEEQIPQFATGHRIDPGGRLVEEDQLRASATVSRPGPAAVSTRRRAVRRACQAAAPGPSARPVPAGDAAHGPLTARRCPSRNRCSPAPSGPRRGRTSATCSRSRAHGLRIAHRVMAQHSGRSRCQRDQPAEGADQRGLARPVGPEQAEDLAVAHGQAHAVDRGQPAEPDGDLAESTTGPAVSRVVPLIRTSPCPAAQDSRRSGP